MQRRKKEKRESYINVFGCDGSGLWWLLLWENGLIFWWMWLKIGRSCRGDGTMVVTVVVLLMIVEELWL